MKNLSTMLRITNRILLQNKKKRTKREKKIGKNTDRPLTVTNVPVDSADKVDAVSDLLLRVERRGFNRRAIERGRAIEVVGVGSVDRSLGVSANVASKHVGAPVGTGVKSVVDNLFDNGGSGGRSNNLGCKIG